MRHDLLKTFCIFTFVFIGFIVIAKAGIGDTVESVMQGGDADIVQFTNTPSFPTGMEINGAFYNSYGNFDFNSFIPNDQIDGSSITKQGNTFNLANKLLQLDNTGLIPNSLLNASSVTLQGNTLVTLQGNTFNGNNQLLKLGVTGLVPNALIDGSSITKQGLLLAGSNITLTPGAGNLTIAAPALGVSGRIIQVQSFTTNTSSANATAVTFGSVFSNVAVSITPQFNTSKIFIWVSGNHHCAPGSSCYLTISRDTTNLAGASGLSACLSNNEDPVSMIAYDSPATIATIKYQVGMRVDGGGSQAFPTNSFGTQPSATIIVAELGQ